MTSNRNTKKLPIKLTKATSNNRLVNNISDTSDDESNTSDSDSTNSDNSDSINKNKSNINNEEVCLMSSESINIKFSITHSKYSFLSTFYDCDLIVDGIRYRHVEGYYESARFQGINNKAVIHLANMHSPKLCKKTAATYFLPIEAKNKWDEDRMYNTMKRINYIKFMTNSELMKKLIDTNDSKLIGMDLKDSYWGIGDDGRGQNKLGILLMEIRHVCKEFNV